MVMVMVVVMMVGRAWREGGVLLLLLLLCCAACQAWDVEEDGVSVTPGHVATFRIMRVEKTETADAIHFRVMYEGSVKPDILIDDRVFDELVKVDTDQHKLGEAEFSFPKLPKNIERRFRYVSFFVEDEIIWLVLNLVTSFNDMIIPENIVEVPQAQGHKVSLKPGETLELDFIVHGDAEGLSFIDPWSVHSNVLVTEGDTVTRYDRYQSSKHQSIRLQQVERTSSESQLHAKFVLNSTEEDVEGVAEIFFSVIFNCSHPCLVIQMSRSVKIEFFTQTHQAAFQEGFVGFIEDYGRNSSHVECEVNSRDCKVSCEVWAAGRMSDVQILHHDQPTPSVNVVSGHRASAWLTLTGVGVEDEGDYVCRARSGERTASKVIRLTVYQWVRVDPDLSRVIRLENGDLLATCVARGIPAPKITFLQLGYMDSPMPYPDQSFPLPQDQTTVMGQLVIPADAAHPERLICVATSMILGSPFSARYSLSFEDQSE